MNRRCSLAGLFFGGGGIGFVFGFGAGAGIGATARGGDGGSGGATGRGVGVASGLGDDESAVCSFVRRRSNCVPATGIAAALDVVVVGSFERALRWTVTASLLPIPAPLLPAARVTCQFV